MTARRNFAPSWQTPELTEAQHSKGRQMAADWKWFPPEEFDNQLKLIEWNDPDYPEGVLIECGNLGRVHFRAPDGVAAGGKRHPRRRRDTTITLARSSAAKSYLAFDPEHPDDRLYMLIEPTARKSLAQRFWQENPLEARLLAAWAVLAGGRHAKRAHKPLAQGGYPQVMAKPVGVMTAVLYAATKKGDGFSYYLHRMGEISCGFPILCCDRSGRLWPCGGSYKSPTPGITD